MVGTDVGMKTVTVAVTALDIGAYAVDRGKCPLAAALARAMPGLTGLTVWRWKVELRAGAYATSHALPDHMIGWLSLADDVSRHSRVWSLVKPVSWDVTVPLPYLGPGRGAG